MQLGLAFSEIKNNNIFFMIRTRDWQVWVLKNKQMNKQTHKQTNKQKTYHNAFKFLVTSGKEISNHFIF